LSSSGTTNQERYWAQISVFDDEDVSDTFLAILKWVACLRPQADAVKTNWTGSPDNTDLHNNIDEATYSQSDYCYTTIDTAAIRFNPDYKVDIHADWDPAEIHGVTVNAHMRGDGDLNTAKAALKYSTETTQEGDSTGIDASGDILDYLLLTERKAGEPWVKGDLTGSLTEFGVKAE
jgi:hypothetical protein